MRYDPPLDAAVSADWQPEGDAPYPALIVGRWNGWAVPVFDRATMGRVVADQAALVSEYSEDPDAVEGLAWDGDRVLVTPQEGDPYLVCPLPADHFLAGRYWFDVGWTWDYALGEGVEDPMDPTVEQGVAFGRLRDSLRVENHGRVAHADCSHTIPIMGDCGRRDAGTAVHEQLGAVHIARDGTVTVTWAERAS